MLALRLLLIVALIGVWAAWQPSASACTCGWPWSLIYQSDASDEAIRQLMNEWIERTDFDEYDLLFRGVVVDAYDDTGSLVEFEVSVVWNHVRDTNQDRTVIHQGHPAACGFWFEEGKEYLVFVNLRYSRGAGGCGPTMQVGNPYAEIELQMLLDHLGEGAPPIPEVVEPTVTPEPVTQPDAPLTQPDAPLTQPDAPLTQPDVPLTQPSEDPTPFWQWAAVAVIVGVVGAGAASTWAFVGRRRERECQKDPKVRSGRRTR